MGKTKKKQDEALMPLLKTPELMSRVCGIGVNKLRELMDNEEIEYLPNGNRRLLLDQAVIDYYHRNKVPIRTEYAKEMNSIEK